MNEIKICETEKGRIEYLQAGRGPTVMIVHGGHDSCRGNYMQQNLIENNFSVLIPTRPGYRGTPITSGKTAESTANLFAALLKRLEIKKVILIGNSAGGPVALEFAKRYPEIVEKLILESAVVKPWFHRLTYQYYGVKVIFNPKRQRKFWQNLTNKFNENPKKTLVDTMKLFTRLNPEAVIDRMNAEEIELLKKTMITGNDSGEGFVHDVEHRAKKINDIVCPTLIIHSKNDASVPFSHAEYTHKMIKNSVLFEAPTDSHFLYIGPGSQEVLEKRMAFIKAGRNTRMKILLVNAASSSQTEIDALQEWIYSSFPGIQKLIRINLNMNKILPCNACMSCQIKNPGICVIKDDMQKLLPTYINSDIVVFITPLFCGGYSSELKKFIDRMCPVLTACFEKRNGETWHIPRYEKRPVMIGIGLNEDPGYSEAIFNQLFSRNMRQLNIRKHSCQIIAKGMNLDELKTSFHQTFNDAGLLI